MIGIGEVINGKYRLVRLLGDGGMGSVYEALHEVLGTRVAIKVLHPELARRTGLVERFLQEARVSAQIKSSHVVQVTDVDRTADGTAFLVMELLEGEPLSGALDRQRKLPVDTACGYGGQILEALEAAHGLGVIHRDLKPENVFVTFSAGKPVLKLIDFGIAKLKRSDGQRSLTVAGVVMGTAEYMAPEQARSADKVDARADIYAVGVMLYEMLAGQRPVSGDDARIIALKVERGEVTPLVQVAPEIPRELAGLVHRAMAARPELRFANAAEMRLMLERIAGGKRGATNVIAAPAGPVHAPTRPLAAVPLTQGVPVAPVEELSATGTMKGAPARAVLAAAAGRSQVATHATNVRSGGTALAEGPIMGPPPVYVHAATPMISGGGRRRRSPLVWLITLPLVVGAAVVVGVIIYSQQAPDAPPPSPGAATTSPAPPASPTSPTTAVNTAPTETVAPLTGPTPKPPPHPGPGPTHPPAGEDAGLPFIFTLPDAGFSFPTAFPSNIPFPPFPFPPAPQPQPQPAPQPHASSEPAPQPTGPMF